MARRLAGFSGWYVVPKHPLLLDVEWKVATAGRIVKEFVRTEGDCRDQALLCLGQRGMRGSIARTSVRSDHCNGNMVVRYPFRSSGILIGCPLG